MEYLKGDIVTIEFMGGHKPHRGLILGSNGGSGFSYLVRMSWNMDGKLFDSVVNASEIKRLVLSPARLMKEFLE